MCAKRKPIWSGSRRGVFVYTKMGKSAAHKYFDSHLDSSVEPENQKEKENAANGRRPNRRIAKESKSNRNQNGMIIKLKNSHIVQFNCVERLFCFPHRFLSTCNGHCALFDPRWSPFVFFSISLLPPPPLLLSCNY